jgi:hypothetical protein
MTDYIMINHLGAVALAKRREFAGPEAQDASCISDAVLLQKLEPGDSVFGPSAVQLIEKVQQKGARYFVFMNPAGRLDSREYSEDELIEAGSCFREIRVDINPEPEAGSSGRFMAACRRLSRRLAWRFGRFFAVLRQGRAFYSLMAIILFGLSLGLISEFGAKIIPPGSDPVSPGNWKWVIARLAGLLIFALALGYWLISGWAESSKPKAGATIIRKPGGKADRQGDNRQLEALVVGLSEPRLYAESDHMKEAEKIEEETVFLKRIAWCRKNLKLQDLAGEDNSPPSDNVKPGFNWSVLLRLIAYNRDMIRAIFTTSDLRADGDYALFLAENDAEYALKMKQLITDVFANSDAEDSRLFCPEIYMVSEARVVRITEQPPNDLSIIANHELGTVQDAVAQAISYAKTALRLNPENIGVDVTNSTSLFSIGATMAALNRGVNITYIDKNDGYW